MFQQPTKISSSIAPATISEDSSIATAEKLLGDDYEKNSTASSLGTSFQCIVITSPMGDYYFDKTITAILSTPAVYDI